MTEKMSWKEKVDLLRLEIQAFNDLADPFYKIEMDDYLKELIITELFPCFGAPQKRRLRQDVNCIKRHYFALARELG